MGWGRLRWESLRSVQATAHPWSSLAALGKLAEIYVEAIRSGAVPCVESVMLALAEIENRAAVKEAVTLYQGLMKEQAKLPTETMQELLELHTRCEQKALDQFMERAFKDGIWSFQAELIVGGPQPGQDFPRATVIPSALGRWRGSRGQGSPRPLPEDAAVPSPEQPRCQHRLPHPANRPLSLLQRLFSLGPKAVLRRGQSWGLAPLSLQPGGVSALAGSLRPSVLPLPC